MNNKKRCIVNYASIGRENYLIGSERLVNSSLNMNVDADILICSPNFTNNAIMQGKYGNQILTYARMPESKEFGLCPSHNDAPYGFKSWIIQEALDMGYKKIMWADSSCVFMKNPEKYWELAEEIGVVVLDNPGCPEATWTADDCLEHMGCDKEFAKTFFEIDAFMMIFNFNYPVAKNLFEKYFEHSRDGICLKGARGSDRPDYNAHRHDQSIISYFVKIANIHPLNYGAWSYYYEFVNRTFFPTFCKVGVSQASMEQINYVLNKRIHEV